MLTKKIQKDIIMGCLFTGIHDVNRNTVLEKDDYDLVKHWANSIIALNLQGVIFHNNFSAATCLQYENKNIHFIQVKYDPNYNPNVYRYFVYKEFLKEYEGQINNIFCTDISDIVVLKNPFEQALYMDNPNKLFCGDEPKTLNDEWMLEHSTHLRNGIKDYYTYEKTFGEQQLLNCGIIGGSVKIMQQFIAELTDIHEKYNQNNHTAFTGDMGAFNYLVRTKYNKKIFYGEPVNTVFKTFQTDNANCWFRHK